MSWKATLKQIEATERRQQRDATKRLRELERLAKEQAKLSSIEQARLEVETFESGVEVLLSIHKERGKLWDWLEFASSLTPHSPRRYSRNELKATLSTANQTLDEARTKDDQEYQEALREFEAEKNEWKRMQDISLRILAGEQKAYVEALTEFSVLSEIADLGSSITYTAHNARLIECSVKVNGRQAIPNELKTLTSTGKVSIKPMPKTRFHEIYQDYVCGCVLRVAREVFALIPVETVLVTASADMLESKTGMTIEQPVLSVAFPRVELGRLHFEHLDPSDAIDNFLHRGDAKASRRSGEFERIIPLTSRDLPQASPENMDFDDLIARIIQLRSDLRTEIEEFRPQQTTFSIHPTETL